MKTTKPRGFDRGGARALIATARPHATVSAKVAAISESLLGSPYESHGLVGSAEEPELFVAPLDRFDCVTYLETALAAARAKDADAFADELRGLRYDGGVVDWARRNHYMIGWARANSKRRAVRPVAAEGLGVKKEKLLDAVPGLPPRKDAFWCVPASKLRRWAPRLATGDLVFFASTKRNLDVFHSGILVRDGGVLKLRHASKSRGRVVEEPLADFLKANRTAGLIVLRPVEEAGAAPARGGGPRKTRA